MMISITQEGQTQEGQTPHRRGWTEGKRRSEPHGAADPTQAGIDRRGPILLVMRKRRPRPRGDGPIQEE